MAVALVTGTDTFGFVNSGSGISNYTGFTVTSATNRVIVLCITVSADVTSMAASWDSAGTPQAMTLIGQQEAEATGYSIYWFGLINPTAGNKTFSITWTGTATARCTAKEFSGVTQVSTAAAFTQVSYDTGSVVGGIPDPTIPAITRGTGDLVVGGWVTQGTVFNVTRSHTLLYDYGGSQPIFRTQYTTTGSAPSLSWAADSSSISWGAVGFNIVEASANVTVTPTTAGLALSTFAPTVSTPSLVTPTTATLTLSTFAPTVNYGYNQSVSGSVTPSGETSMGLVLLQSVAGSITTVGSLITQYIAQKLSSGAVARAGIYLRRFMGRR